jgi:nicotinamide riboside transporter PnuC
MVRFLAAGFLIAHGGIHAAIWISPRRSDAPFDAAHSWLFGEVRPATIVLAIIAAVAFLAAGVGYFGAQDWWALAATAGSAVSILLLTLTFSPWWLAAFAINVALVILAWPTLTEAMR